MVRRIQRTFPISMSIDDIEIRLQITRFDVKQAQHFDHLWDRATTDRAERLLLVRHPGEEMERHQVTALSAETRAGLQQLVAELKQRQAAPAEGQTGPTVEECLGALEQLAGALNPTDEWVIPDAEIRARRFRELDAAGRARYDELVQEDQAAFEKFVVEALNSYVRVEPGQLELEEQVPGAGGTVEDRVRPVLTGGDLMQCYGGRHGFIGDLVKLIRLENRLSDALKNGFRSRFASRSSSPTNERDRTPNGASPAPTADSAALEASATSGAVTASSAAPLSGETRTTP